MKEEADTEEVVLGVAEVTLEVGGAHEKDNKEDGDEVVGLLAGIRVTMQGKSL